MAGAVLTMGSVLGVLAPVAGSTAAWAGGPEHVKFTETGEFTVEAGEFCDFTLNVAGTFSDNAVSLPGQVDPSLHVSIRGHECGHRFRADQREPRHRVHRCGRPEQGGRASRYPPDSRRKAR